MERLLVVEDESAIRQFILEVLESAGYEVFGAASLRAGLAEVGVKKPDLVILDLGLPDGDGTELIRDIRSWSTNPIIVLSARIDDTDKIGALDLGADDYLVKPFSVQELLARVRAALRRVSSSAAAKSKNITFGECEFDEKERVVLKQGKRVHLTQVEFKLLAVLAAHEGQVFTHRQLMRVVWGPASAEHVHYLRIYMGHLRRKLEMNPARPVHFLTEIGIGYRFIAQANRPSSSFQGKHSP